MKKTMIMVAMVVAAFVSCVFSYKAGKNEGTDLGYAEGYNRGVDYGYNTGVDDAYASRNEIRSQIFNEMYNYGVDRFASIGYTFEVDGVVKLVQLKVIDTAVVDPSVYSKSES